jgi:ketosteroid isomerase-like protein
MATADSERNLKRVRAGLDAFNRGDVDGVLAVLADDVEIFSSPALANPGTYHGHPGYQEWVGEWLEAWEGLAISVERIEPVGERHVVVGVLQTARGQGSGVEVEMTTAFMFELDERETRALHLYATWDEAVAAAERREGPGRE